MRTPSRLGSRLPEPTADPCTSGTHHFGGAWLSTIEVLLRIMGLDCSSGSADNVSRKYDMLKLQNI